MKKLVVLIVVLGIAGYFGYPYFKVYQIRNTPTESGFDLPISSEMSYADLGEVLQSSGYIESSSDFIILVNLHTVIDKVLIQKGYNKV